MSSLLATIALVEERGKAMLYRALSVLAVLLAVALPASAHTWDEPWHREVVKQADSFGLFELVDDKRGTALKRIRILAGVTTPDIFVLSGYYQPGYFNSSDHEDHFGLEAGERAYLMLKQDGARWLLATPTAGVDVLREDAFVAATYRISFNQALQHPDAYERVQACVFRRLHRETCDVALLESDLDTPLHEKAAALSETATAEEQDLFFRQHVALETAYLLNRDLPLALLEPFLKSDFFHTQLSGVRALAANQDPHRDARLLEFIRDDSRTPVARVMAVRMAQESGHAALLDQIRAYGPQASEEESHLPVGSIMDPRIGTAYPSSLKQAIEMLSLSSND